MLPPHFPTHRSLLFRSTHSPLLAPVVAQAGEGNIPEDAGGRVIFVIVGVAIVALYLLLRRTRRRSEEAYWAHRAREQELRDSDPDMRDDT